MRYYNKANGTEIFDNNRVPPHLRYDAGNPDHLALPDENPFFSPLPEGYEIEYDVDNVPIALVAIPDYYLNIAKGRKTDEIIEQFDLIAESKGIRVSYYDVSQDLALRGIPPSPTPEQAAIYNNVEVANMAIATVEAYTQVQAVDAFDATIPAGTNYTGDTWY
jgi:hypothetical protein